MQTKGGRAEEEDRLLEEHGFERTAATDREQWVRREEGPRLYTRTQALMKARREAASCGPLFFVRYCKHLSLV